MSHRAQHQALCRPSSCVQRSRKYVCAQANLSHSHVKIVLAPGGHHVWTLALGTTHPVHHSGLHFDHLPRAPGDQKMVIATWSWQAY